MNWEAIAALGQSLSAILVLITLIYLAIQVRYAKNAAADANRLASARGVCEYQLAVATNDLLIQSIAVANGYGSWYEKLSEDLGITVEEAMRADAVSLYWIWLMWGHYSSTNNKEDLAELGKTIGKFFNSSRAIKYSWENSPFAKLLLNKHYADFVDRHMQKYKE